MGKGSAVLLSAVIFFASGFLAECKGLSRTNDAAAATPIKTSSR